MLGRKNTQLGRRGGCRRGRRWGGRGFTLIELLVVIAIIALLVSMLLPSLAGARDTARDVICKSNMKQVGVAIQMYLDAQKDPYWMELYAGKVARDRQADLPEDLRPFAGVLTNNANANKTHWYVGYALKEFLGAGNESAIYKCPRAAGGLSVKTPWIQQELTVGSRSYLDPSDPAYANIATRQDVKKYSEYFFNDSVAMRSIYDQRPEPGGKYGSGLVGRPYRMVRNPSELVWMADAPDDFPRHGSSKRAPHKTDLDAWKFGKATIHMLRGDLRVQAFTWAERNDLRDKYGSSPKFYSWGHLYE